MTGNGRESAAQTQAALLAKERVLRDARRDKANVDRDLPAVGLALSGGGIRSATFCIGLMRALAKNGVFKRVDYLSTVSGGGYAGSSVGRLYDSTSATPEAVEAGVANDQSLWLWWLRNNGRYLTPAGAADLIVATAGQLRSFLVTQFEVLVMSMALSCLITLLHLGLGSALIKGHQLGLPGSPWWWLMVVPAVIALTAAYAYWFLGKQRGAGFATALLALGVGAYAWHVSSSAQDAFSQAVELGKTLDNEGSVMFMAWLSGVLGLGFLLSPLGWLIAKGMSRTIGDERSRVMLTHTLARCLTVFLALAAFGALDAVSWYFSFLFTSVLNGHISSPLGIGIGTVSLLVAGARVVLPLLQSRSSWVKQLPVAQIANIAGMVVVVLIMLMWLTLLQMFVFSTTDTFPGSPLPNAWGRWGGVAGTTVLFLLFNGFILNQLNRSSLHPFYRSRLARTFVSVGNDESRVASRTTTSWRFPGSITDTRSRESTAGVKQVSDLIDGDDTLLANYKPHESGGPIHLINCCINQTEDDRTGNYNADRKGVNLTISALGAETGTRLPADITNPHWQQSTLAEWVAISGAAVGSGMGSLTKPGMAAMIFLSGLRLGYWQHGLLSRWGNMALPFQKYLAMFDEMFARFPGLQASRWYISDGGHFDNTGVYALLKRKLPLIVLADCGADPDYIFADVENLIRKARIDHDATIEFITPSSIRHLTGTWAPYLGTPDTIQPGSGNDYLLLARITYDDATTGCLLIVKPRCKKRLPLDVAGYADRNPTFPQQSTANQFFSEEQWESYQHLGSTLGSVIDETLLASLPQWVAQGRVAGANSQALSPDKPKLTRAQRIATTVGTSLGIGAILTGLLAAWQVWDGRSQGNTQEMTSFGGEARALMSDLNSDSRKAKGYDRELDARVNLLTNMANNMSVSDEQRRVLSDIAAMLQDLCPSKDEDLKDSCSANLASLQGAGATDMHFEQSHADYRAFALKSPPKMPATAVTQSQDAEEARKLAAQDKQAQQSLAAAKAVEQAAREKLAMVERHAEVLRQSQAEARAPASVGYVEAAGSAPPPPSPPPPPVAAAPAPAPVTAAAPATPSAPDVDTEAARRAVEQATRAVDIASKKAQATSELAETASQKAHRTGITADARDAFNAAITACSGSSRTYILYTQIYDEAQRADAGALIQNVSAIGISTPGIENVTETAKRNGRTAPGRWTQATLLYRAGSADCANRLVDYLGKAYDGLGPFKAYPMPARMGGAANVMELWLPAKSTNPSPAN
ncbi:MULTISPECIES: patatin-like phospholipase family protein [Dyella]|uniref:Uncharacterized protein n=1 Tax=Dyella soli TaxID=522319 RepID=A0A4R0YT73_9GAMM|nr:MULTISPECIES: patatin-like phospholipase family protein [Dyella]TCI12422.1 hypothetical protein EZM97_03475 [Dyella soli]